MSDEPEQPREPTPFEKFERLAKALVRLSKKEIDDVQRKPETEGKTEKDSSEEVLS